MPRNTQKVTVSISRRGTIVFVLDRGTERRLEGDAWMRRERNGRL